MSLRALLVRGLLVALATTARAAELPVEAARPAHGEAPAPERFQNPDALLDTERLAVLLGDGQTPAGASLTVLDARPREEYEAGHLPGAHNLESDPLQDPERQPYYLPDPKTVAKFTAAAGINPDTRVVVYDAHGGRLAARVWFVLWVSGHDCVSILDGGLPKWKDEHRALTRDAPPAPSRQGTWKPAARLRGLCGLGDVKAFRVPPTPGRLPPTLLLDARSYPEYTGADIRGRLAGHIPGAVNLPWDGLLRAVGAQGASAEQKGYWVWREPAEIHALLRAAGIQPGQPLIVYDQSGGRAAHLLFTLHLMGYSHVANYVGGWREYGSRDDVEVEK